MALAHPRVLLPSCSMAGFSRPAINRTTPSPPKVMALSDAGVRQMACIVLRCALSTVKRCIPPSGAEGPGGGRLAEVLLAAGGGLRARVFDSVDSVRAHPSTPTRPLSTPPLLCIYIYIYMCMYIYIYTHTHTYMCI